MLYLVTGGAGFIGSHLVRVLAQRGDLVRVLDNFNTGSAERVRQIAEMFPNRVEIISGDIRDPEDCAAACGGADFVLHQAAIASVPRSFADSAECASVNVLGTVTLLEAARSSGSVRRVIFASSCAVYGNSRQPSVGERARIDPLTPYAGSKFAGELFCRSYSRHMGLSTVCLRYFNVYGEGQNPNGAYAAVIPRFIELGARGDVVKICGDGRQVRDFVNVSDIVAANFAGCMAASESVDGKSFNIGTGVATSLNDLVAELSSLMDRPLIIRREPARLGDIRRSVSSIDLAQRVMGYKPEITLRLGLQAMVLHAKK
jgi:nucleoside-diphosphate-sugar epimerase